MLKLTVVTLLTALLLQASSYVEVVSMFDVKSTVKKIKKAINKKEGFEVFSIINHTKNAHKVNMSLPDTQLIIFGNPKAGTKLIQANPLMAYELPLKILVAKRGNQTVISYRSADWLARGYGLETSPIIPKIRNVMHFFVSTCIATK